MLWFTEFGPLTILISPVLIFINIIIIAQLKFFLKDEFSFWIGVLALFTPIIMLVIDFLLTRTQISSDLMIQSSNPNSNK